MAMDSKKSGALGGQARALNMTPEQRFESARKAARARWAVRASDSGADELTVGKLMNAERCVKAGDCIGGELALAIIALARRTVAAEARVKELEAELEEERKPFTGSGGGPWWKDAERIPYEDERREVPDA